MPLFSRSLKPESEDEMPNNDEAATGTPPSSRHTIGELLRETRQSCGGDVDRIAATLRIRAAYLRAIEDGHYDRLPGPVYALGFVRAYADHLGLDADEAVRRFKQETVGFEVSRDLSFPVPLSERSIPGGTMLLAALILAVCGYGLWYYVSTGEHTRPERVSAVPPELAETPKLPSTAAPAKPATLATTSPAAAPSAPAAPAPDKANAVATNTASAPGAPSIAPAMPATPSAAARSAKPPTTATTTASAAPAPAKPTVTVTPVPAPSAAAPSVAAVAPPAVSSPVTSTNAITATTATASVAPVSAMAEAPAAPAPYQPHVYGVPTGPSDITIRATKDSWVRINDPTGQVVTERILHPGDSVRVPQASGLVLTTGNAAGLVFDVEGKTAPGIGGTVRHDIALDPGKLLAGTAAASASD